MHKCHVAHSSDLIGENMDKVDNSSLEELMKKELTVEMQNEFFEILKESQLFMPVSYSKNIFEGIENAEAGDVIEPEGQVGFNITYITDSDGNNAVPLFTSSEILDSVVESSSMAIYMSDLADLLKQTDKYSIIAINPFTDFDINMPVEAFLSLFEDPLEKQKKSLNKILAILKEHSVELEENTTLFIRSDENFMIENAVDKVFTAKVPFYVSSSPKYGEDMKYTNILLMPKSKKILPLDPDRQLDILIAPGTEFELQDTMDGTQNLWMCGAQPFYEK